MFFDNNGQALKRLHARLVDIHRGFKNGVDSAGNPEVALFFDRFRAMHDRHMADLNRLMLARGLSPNADGSWARLNHAGVLAFRTMPDRLDARATDPAIRGERIVLDLYDEALEAVGSDGDARAVLLAHKGEILRSVTFDTLPQAA